MFTPLTDDLLQRQSDLNRNAPGTTTAATADGSQSTAVNMSGLSVARGTVLGMSLDKMTRTKDAADGASTAALDKESGLNVVHILKKMGELRGTTTVMVTHDNRILDLADRIITLEEGHSIDVTTGL